MEKELSRLFEEICVINRICKNSIAKLRVFDKNQNGKIDVGEELLDLATWILQDSNVKHDYQPSAPEKEKFVQNILGRFSKSEDGSLSLMDMALLHDELLVPFLPLATVRCTF